MSINITIKNNHKHCLEMGMAAKTQVPCQCAGYDNGMRTLGDPDCPECGGDGFYAMDVFPFELNMASTNFENLWKLLGLDVTAVGLDPRRLLKALKITNLDTLVRGVRKYKNEYFGGVSMEQAVRYKVKLTEMAEEASRREEPIVWG